MKRHILIVAFVMTWSAAMTIQETRVLAQGTPTGTISGQIVDSSGLPVPGATVSAESPALQGARSSLSTDNGDYVLPFLPAGQYTLIFGLQGFRTVEVQQGVAVAQSYAINVTLEPASVSEVVQVTGHAETISSSGSAATTIKAELVNALPTTRDLSAAALLAPSVKSTGPGNNITIAGALSYESLYLIDGVVINENLRGQPLNLYVEDALEQTTVLTSGVSAEYGRFSGGIVNAITKSGGNAFGGSFRDSFANDKWRARSPYPGDTKINKTTPTYEMTLGGPLVRDRLWFFSAGRFRDTSDAMSGVTTATNIPYVYGTRETRAEGKLTYSPNSRNTIKGSYMKIWQTDVNTTGFPVLDLASLYDKETSQDLLSLHYTGIVKPNFFVEAQLSQRHLTARGAGSQYTDPIRGTLLIDQSRNARFWSPTFCGVCSDDRRDNQDVILKGNYFLSTSGLGSHHMVFGFDNYRDKRLANNHQSGSDYRIWATKAIIGDDNTPYPVFDANTLFAWQPIPIESTGNNFQTYSAFYNDSWRYSRRLTINLGVRWDKNVGNDQTGARVIDDSAFSPRLSVTFAPTDEGKWTLTGSYARYVNSIANSLGDAGSSAGNSATYAWLYAGPAVNTSGPPYITSDVAIERFFDWYASVGGNGNTLPYFQAPTLPGVASRVSGTLASPSGDEFTGGVSHQLGGRGSLRADLVYRRFRNFYNARVDQSTGQVTNALGKAFDLTIFDNTNDVERQYWGLNIQGTYNLPRTQVGGYYALSRAWGNFDGETTAAGPSAATPHYYPEYTVAAWNRPVGDLSMDQRHRLRAYMTYSIPLRASFGSLDASVLQQYDSGTPYYAAGFIKSSSYVDPAINARYVSPGGGPALYYFTARDAYHTDPDIRTDVALNYAHKIGVRNAVAFAQFHLLNVFNQSGLSNISQINTAVLTPLSTSSLQAFNPFTTTPVRDVNWRPGPQFGQANGKSAYTTPRTFRFSIGFRF